MAGVDFVEEKEPYVWLGYRVRLGYGLFLALSWTTVDGARSFPRPSTKPRPLVDEVPSSSEGGVGVRGGAGMGNREADIAMFRAAAADSKNSVACGCDVTKERQ